MTLAQMAQVRTILGELWDQGFRWFHHGDCVGSDSMAHELASLRGFDIVVHPPTDPKHRAHRIGDVEEDPRPYLERNHAIVDAVSTMIATPDGEERLRSGTWATVRYARKRKRAIYIVFPAGNTSYE